MQRCPHFACWLCAASPHFCTSKLKQLKLIIELFHLFCANWWPHKGGEHCHARGIRWSRPRGRPSHEITHFLILCKYSIHRNKTSIRHHLSPHPHHYFINNPTSPHSSPSSTGYIFHFISFFTFSYRCCKRPCHHNTCTRSLYSLSPSIIPNPIAYA